MHSPLRFAHWHCLAAAALLLLIFGAGAQLRAQDTQTVDSRDFSLTGSGFVIAKLENGAKAFSNRDYVWQAIPASLRGRRYTKSAGGEPPHLTVHARQDMVLDVMTSNEQRGVDVASWNQPGTSFTYTDGKGKTGKGTRVVLLHKTLQKGQDFELPQGNWSGVLVIFPD